MDSSTSFHASFDMNLMKNDKVKIFGKVHLASDETRDITNMRDINLKTSAVVM